MGMQVNQALSKLRPKGHGPSDLALKIYHTSLEGIFTVPKTYRDLLFSEIGTI